MPKHQEEIIVRSYVCTRNSLPISFLFLHTIEPSSDSQGKTLVMNLGGGRDCHESGKKFGHGGWNILSLPSPRGQKS